MLNLITILPFNVKLSHAKFVYDLQAEVLRLHPKMSLRYAQLDWKVIPLVFLGKGEVNQKLKKTQVHASTT